MFVSRTNACRDEARRGALTSISQDLSPRANCDGMTVALPLVIVFAHLVPEQDPYIF